MGLNGKSRLSKAGIGEVTATARFVRIVDIRGHSVLSNPQTQTKRLTCHPVFTIRAHPQGPGFVRGFAIVRKSSCLQQK